MSTKLSEILKTAHSTDWTYPYNFSVEIYPLNDDMKILCGWTDVKKMSEKITLSLKCINIPQKSCNSVEEFNGIEWRHINTRDELYDITMTFRDFNFGELYRKFSTAFTQTKYNYFDKLLFNIQVFFDANDGSEDKICIFETSEALLKSVSQLQLNHSTKDEILEFDVSFKCNTPSHSENFIKGKIKNLNYNLRESLENRAKTLLNNAVTGVLSSIKNKIF